MTASDWVRGDLLGIRIPARSEVLRAAGAPFLTEAFHATGTLGPDNRVTRIRSFQEWRGGSTGRKVLMSVEYEKAAQDLHTDLFVKFSRDFEEARRDQARVQMELETRFALLSRTPGFPVVVPRCYLADYHRDSGTGILVSQSIPFGTCGIERHYEKCLDYEMPEPFEHYQALIRAIAGLSGTHKAGRLPESVGVQFPFDPTKLRVSTREPYTADQLTYRVDRYSNFAAKFPHLLPRNITARSFIARLRDEVILVSRQEPVIQRLLRSNPAMIALSHWNANADNAWFWRHPGGGLECGLFDWGNVSQMNVAMSLWGCLSGASTNLWDGHLDQLLELYADEFGNSGGGELDLDELKLHLLLYVALMGVTWLLDAPALIQAQLPDLADVEGVEDVRFKENEMARCQLHMLTTFLNVWETQDIGKVLTDFLGNSPTP